MIKLITDSAGDLPQEIVNQYEIDVVPLYVLLSEQEFADGVEINSKEVLQGMREGQVYKTAQVSVNTFMELFTRYAQEKVTCFYVAFSSELSGTWQAAELAREQVIEQYPDFELEIVNTKCASLGEGLVVYQAAKLLAAGKPLSQVVEAVKFYSQHMEHIFTVDDLEYLYRGGRVSRTAAFIGGVLNIKPIIDVEDGKLIPIEKARGRKKAINRIIKIMADRGVDLKNQLIAISHGDVPEEAETLTDIITAEFGCDKFLINTIGSVIGAHAGPGTLAVFFLNQQVPSEYKAE